MDMEVAVIGPGTMGLMIARRLVDLGLCQERDLRLSRVRPGRRARVEQVLPGAGIPEGNREAVDGADLIVLAVKPKSVQAVAAELRSRVRDNALILSVVTGLDLETMRGDFGSPNVVRTSTNIGIECGAATTYWISGEGVSAEARSVAVEIITSWGDEIECSDESLLDIAMVGVGSGPALVIEFAHALTRAMVTQGMPHDLAERGILSLLKGTVELRAAAQDRSMAYFQQEVVTPGGITAEALLALEEGRFRATVINAFRRAHHKVSRLAAIEKGDDSL
jgi:pyrroline-5-carboxylate reductase